MSCLLAARTDVLPRLEGRYDVEKREALDASGVVERESITDARAPIMAGESETRMTEAFRGFHDIEREDALRIRLAVSAWRRGGASVAAHVEQDHTMRLGKSRRDAVPTRMGLRKAVQEHERRSLACEPCEDAPHANLDEPCLKAGEEVGKVVHRVSREE